MKGIDEGRADESQEQETTKENVRLRECTYIPASNLYIPDSPSPDSFISGPFLDNFILQAVEDIT